MSRKHILADIHNLGLDPKVAHVVVNYKGHLRPPAQPAQVVEVVEEVTKVVQAPLEKQQKPIEVVVAKPKEIVAEKPKEVIKVAKTEAVIDAPVEIVTKSLVEIVEAETGKKKQKKEKV